MYCPECGHDNPDDAQSCQTCNSALRDKEIQQSKVKLSKLAILSLILSVFSPLLFVVTGIPAIIIGIISYRKIKHSGGVLKGKPISIVGIIISSLSCFILLLWGLDAPPIPNDYTVADLRSAPADCEESYELLRSLVYLFVDPRQEIEDLNYSIALVESITGQKSQLQLPKDLIDKYLQDDEYEPLLSDEDRALICEVAEIIEKGTDAELSDILIKNAGTIKQIWDKTLKARKIIHKLNEFPEIADLYEPSLNTQSLKILPLIELSKLYNVYAYIQTEPNNIHNFTKELIELDSVFRKLSPNTRQLIFKLCCYVIMRTNNLTANTIANKPQTSQESIELMAEHFTPFTKEQMSLKNSVLFEYLFMKYALSETPDEILLKIIPAFKKNSTLRMYRNYCEDLIYAAEDMNDTSRKRLLVWPSCYPFKEPVFPKRNDKKMPFLYRCYNPAGSVFLAMINKNIFKNIPEENHKTKGQSELIQIVLNKRLGKEVDFDTPAYSGKYIVDIENKIISNPGPDGEPKTNDDIKLPINPEVLGFLN